MKLLAAVVTALTLLGFAGAAVAQCAGHAKPAGETAQKDKKILPPGQEAS